MIKSKIRHNRIEMFTIAAMDGILNLEVDAIDYK